MQSTAASLKRNLRPSQTQDPPNLESEKDSTDPLTSLNSKDTCFPTATKTTEREQENDYPKITRVISSDSSSNSSTESCSSEESALRRTRSSPSSTSSITADTDAAFYKLDVANLPDRLFHPHVPVEEWLATCETTSNKHGFPPNSLNKMHPIPWIIEFERIVGFTLYQFLNVLPFLTVPLWILYRVVATPLARGLVVAILGYVGILATLMMLLEPIFLKHYRQRRFLLADVTDVQRNQYVYTERNTTKYLSVQFVWPASIHRQASSSPSTSSSPLLQETPVLFCIVPHGVVSWGIAAYPLWSKVWNDRICRWSIAPIVLKIPLVRYLARKVGYIPAQQSTILETLTKRDENVGLVLDGIAGMFSGSTSSKSNKKNNNVETAFLKQRKGIVKIALKAGVPIVPVYGFGHTSLYTVCVDHFGILERISTTLQTSITPFFGRWGWLLGPPRRVPVTVCLGEPVMCPQIDQPTQEQIDHYHKELLQAYKVLFDTHKEAYGWGDKTLRFV